MTNAGDNGAVESSACCDVAEYLVVTDRRMTNVIRVTQRRNKYVFFKLFSPNTNLIFLGQFLFHSLIIVASHFCFYFQKFLFIVEQSSPKIFRSCDRPVASRK